MSLREKIIEVLHKRFIGENKAEAMADEILTAISSEPAAVPALQPTIQQMRICEHGQLARKCPLCEAAETIADLKARLEASEKTLEDTPRLICTMIGNDLMTEPSMFERSTVCKFVRGWFRTNSVAALSKKESKT